MSKQYILGFKPCIKGFGVHDPAACLLEDGKIVAAVAEERLIRKKHANNINPLRAIEYCLAEGGITMEDLACVSLPYVPRLKLKALMPNLKGRLQKPMSLRQRVYTFTDYFQRVGTAFVDNKERIRKIFQIPPHVEIDLVPHHEAHAASAFFCSGFEESSVITLDGGGEYDCTVLWHGKGETLERLKTFTYPNSLGLFYSVVTEYLGFGAYDGEYMVMGLAPYGERDPEILERMSRLFHQENGDYRVDLLIRRPVFFDQAIEEIDALFQARRERSEAAPITEKQKKIAWALQHTLEEAVIRLVAQNHERTGSKNLCLAGGVALNCKMNKRLLETEFVENIFVQPASGDDGLAIGTAQISQLRRGPLPNERLDTVYFGPGYTNEEIEERLKKFKLDYERLSDSELIERTARLLADEKLVGWFQGRMEFGPRALGNRSILASPMKPEMKDLVNDIVKRRDAWRPFAPVVMEEKADEYFVKAFPAPFMTITFDVRPEARGKIPAVTHVDGTARIQTVNARQNRRYYDLLSAFERLTGCAVLLNTSFNLKGEPIVNTPEDAIVDFFRSGLDALAIGNFLLLKR